VIHRHAAVLQYELEIAVADGEHQIPSDRPKDHLSGELRSFESLILPYLCCSSPCRQATISYPTGPAEQMQQNPCGFDV
jgi:hypothetical protein